VTAMRRPDLDYLAFLLLGFLLGLAAFAAVGVLWFISFAIQNWLAG
jgi:hypothetical protein